MCLTRIKSSESFPSLKIKLGNKRLRTCLKKKTHIYGPAGTPHEKLKLNVFLFVLAYCTNL